MSELTDSIAEDHWVTNHPHTHCVGCGWWEPRKNEDVMVTLRRHVAEVTADALRPDLQAAALALVEVGKKAIVVKPTLDQPYADDPLSTPWTRFMESPARRAYNLGTELRRKYRD